MELFGYGYVHWLNVASLLLLTGAPILGVAAGYFISHRRRAHKN